MNATSFFTNLSKSLSTINTTIRTTNETTDKNKLKLEEICKSIVNLATLTQKQYNSNIQHIEFIEKTVEQLKID